MIYIASPYSGTPEQMRDRYLKTEAFTAAGLRQGFSVLSPIVHCHNMADRWTLSRDFKFWKFFNFDLLQNAQALVVLQLPGHEESIGVQSEVEYARNLRKEVIGMETEDFSESNLDGAWQVLAERKPHLCLKRQIN